MNLRGIIARGPPLMPFSIFFLRIAIVLVSIIVLAISGWGIDLFQNPPGLSSLLKRSSMDIPGLGNIDIPDTSVSSLSSAGYGIWRGDAALVFMLFMAVFTLACTVAITAFERFLPNYYFRIGSLAAYILNIVLLLSAWGYAASTASAIAPLNVAGASKYYRSLAGAFGAAAGLGALLWLLVIANTVMYLLACMKTPASTHSAAPSTTQLGEVPSKEGGYPQPQHPYGQQQHQQQYPHQYGPPQ